MYQVETDVERGILRLTFSQHVSAAEAKSCRDAVATSLASLAPGFCILTDLSELVEMDFACAPDIRGIMDLCQAKGVSRIVRIIPDIRKDIGFTLMSYFHYGRNVVMVTCASMAEAIERLGN